MGKDTPPIDELAGRFREQLVDGCSANLAGVLAAADEWLFGLVEAAASNNERRVFQDCMRVLRSHRAGLERGFREDLHTAFQVGARLTAATVKPVVRYQELSLQNSDEVEGAIATSRLGSRLSTVCADQIWELERRLRWWTAERQAPLPPDAADPELVCEAFRQAVDGLDTDTEIRAILHRMFRELFVPGMKGVYGEALAFLREHGVEEQQYTAVRPGPALARGPKAEAAAAGPLQAGAGPVLDSATQAALQAVMQAPQHGDDADGRLAADLSAAAGGQSVAAWDAERAQSYLQKAAVIGRMFSVLLDDAELGDGLKGTFDALRLPMIKAGISDASFFSEQPHPLRDAVAELSQLAAAVQRFNPEGLGRVDELVGSVLGSADIDPQLLYDDGQPVSMLSERDVERFVAFQEASRKRRIRALSRRALQIAGEEIAVRSDKLPLAEAAREFLDLAMLPLLTDRALKQGVGSEPWTASIGLLERCLQALDPATASSLSGDAIGALEADVGAALAELGLPETRRGKLQESFTRVAAAARSRQVAKGAVHHGPAAFGREEVAGLFARDGDWFSVFDRAREDRRWLRVQAKSEQGIVFAEFNGDNALELAVEEFVEDLLAGRTVAVDPSPRARQALEQLGVRSTDSGT